MSSNTYFCVLHTSTGNILYAGTSEAATAAALEPGTVYGYGRTKFMAWLDAHRRRDAVPPQRPDEVQG
jgi:CRP-like cAMP-binding protein